MGHVRNVCMPHAMGDVISGIGISIAAADSIGYRAPAQYRSNPTTKHVHIPSHTIQNTVIQTAALCTPQSNCL